MGELHPEVTRGLTDLLTSANHNSSPRLVQYTGSSITMTSPLRRMATVREDIESQAVTLAPSDEFEGTEPPGAIKHEVERQIRGRPGAPPPSGPALKAPVKEGKSTSSSRAKDLIRHTVLNFTPSWFSVNSEYCRRIRRHPGIVLIASPPRASICAPS